MVSSSFELFSGVSQGSVPVPIIFNLQMKPLGHIINQFGFNYYLYADDGQIYFAFNADSAKSNVLRNCLRTVEKFNKLKLNKSKTQCIVFNRQVCKFAEDVFENNFCDNSTLRCVRNLGVFLDCNISMEEQIKSTIKKCYFQIRNVGKIGQYTNEKNCKMFVNNLIILHTGYWNALHYSLPDCLLSGLPFRAYFYDLYLFSRAMSLKT